MVVPGPGGRGRNTALHVTPDGELAATYAKLHLFDVEVDGTTYRESDREDAGTEAVVSDGIGLAICYDLRFPTLFEELQRRGATLFAVPSAFTLPTTPRPLGRPRPRPRDRAAGVRRRREPGRRARAGLRSGGRSCIVDPWGVVPRAGARHRGPRVADLDRPTSARSARACPP
jgi:predicted amidohydrolase